MKKQLTQLVENLIKKALFPFPKLLKEFIFRKVKKKKNGLYKKNEDLYFVENHLLPTDTFFDIGSNMGVYSHIALTIVPARSIYIFEPISFLRKTLRVMFKESHVMHYALSDKQSIAKFKIPIIKGSLLDTRGTLETNFKESGEENSRLLEIETITLDEFVKKNKVPKVDFMKIDVEGHELKVIEGSLSVLGNQKPKLLIEIENRHHSQLEELNRILEILLTLGYRMYYLDKETISTKEITGNHLDFIVSQKDDSVNYVNNYFFSIGSV